MQKLKLPKSKRVTGLYLFCNKSNCKKWYRDDTEVDCKHNMLIYKSKVHVPNTKNKARTKNHASINVFDEAVVQHSIFVKYLNDSAFVAKVVDKHSKPVLLTDCFAVFMGFLHNENVAAFKQKQRTKVRIAACERAFRYFLDSLKERRIDTSIMKFTDVDEHHCGFLTSDLRKRGLRNKTYNNIMLDLKTFFLYTLKAYYPDKPNPLSGFRKRKVVPFIDTITEAEFHALLNVITLENGVTDAKKKVNHYRNWLIDAFNLGLLTGARREEILKLRWSDIVLDENGDFLFFEINHLKFSRAKSELVSDDEYEVKHIMFFKELEDFVRGLGYDEKKGSQEYLIGPNSRAKRETMMADMSNAFTHYFKIINNGKGKEFRFLRKTYATMVKRLYPEHAHVITSHGGQDVLDKHYVHLARLIRDTRKSMQISDSKK